jgi:metal-dependent hydrolase (beta-lactamase superfamily II)
LEFAVKKSHPDHYSGMEFEDEKENPQTQQTQIIKMTQQLTQSSKKRKQLSISERRELRASYRNLNDETEGT